MKNKSSYMRFTILICTMLLIVGCSLDSDYTITAEEIADHRTDEMKSIELIGGGNFNFQPNTWKYVQIRKAAAGIFHVNSVDAVPLQVIKDAVAYDGVLTQEELMQKDTCTLFALNTTYGRSLTFVPENQVKFYQSINLITGIDETGVFRVIDERDINSAEIQQLNPWKLIGLGVGVAAIVLVVIAIKILNEMQGSISKIKLF